VNSFSQENVVFAYHISILDSRTQTPVYEAQIRHKCGSSSAISFSNNKGEAQISCNQPRLNVILIHEFYKTQTDLVLKPENAYKNNIDTLFYRIFLEPKDAKMTNEVVVTNPYRPQAIYASERLSVADFEILEDEQLLLLTYERKLNQGAELLVVDNDEKVVMAKTVGKDALHLFKDYRGLIHLMSKNSLEYVYREDEAFDLVPMDKQYYERYIAPIIDTSRTKFYFTNYRQTYPAAEFFVYDDLDSTYAKISKISDDIMMEMFETEYLWVDIRTKLWARQMEQQTGVSKENIVGEVVFTQSIFYKPIYAPMFMKNDTIYLFDFYKDYVRTFNRNGNPIDSLDIAIHHDEKKTGWCNRLIQDDVTGCVFAVFDKGGYTVICPIDLNTGGLGVPIRLDFRYIEKLIIHNNAAYYTYRPFESNQKKYLFKQLLPLFFGEGVTARDGRR